MALLALTAGLASASPGKQGGIFVLGTTGASTQVDPQVAYVTTAWWLEYATAAKLYNYPDKSGQAGGLLRPEVASGFTVSGDGRTYTFTIRKGFRFSDGAPVTARNFAYAIKRAMDADLASPASAYMHAGALGAGEREQAGHPPEQSRRLSAHQAGDAVLPGDLAEAAAEDAR